MMKVGGSCHCAELAYEPQARAVKDNQQRRFEAGGLVLHPQETRIACCHLRQPRDSSVHKKCDVLGYSFRRRRGGCLLTSRRRSAPRRMS